MNDFANGFKAGYVAAMGLKVGEYFPGSMGFADAYARDRKSMAWRGAADGYYAGLPRGLWTDDEGYVTKIER